jgi:hypothetical protein
LVGEFFSAALFDLLPTFFASSQLKFFPSKLGVAGGTKQREYSDSGAELPFHQ